MNPPLRWMMKRPGLWIPVFFLCHVPLAAQSDGEGTSVSALGGTFLVRTGNSMARHNQAGLGQLSQRTFSIQHNRPFLLKELGISTLALQVPVSHGGLGAVVSHFGIRGLGYTSAWIASGIRIFEGWCAGIGLHFWNFSREAQPFHHPGFSFAAGIRVQISEQVELGAHLAHPAGFYSRDIGRAVPPPVLTVGGSWSLYTTAVYYVEAEFKNGQPISLKHGLEWNAGQVFVLQMGMHSAPLTISCGIGMTLRRWKLHTAYSFRPDSGSTPSISIDYAW